MKIQCEAFSLGFSNRTWEATIDILRSHRIQLVVDIRTLPGSKYTPHFNQENLLRALPRETIEYVHLKALGGLRHPDKRSSANAAWRNDSFRAYADYMQTREFAEALDVLVRLLTGKRTAFACTEAVFWRCHRQLVADALLVRGIAVGHIFDARKIELHTLTKFASVHGREITYPLPVEFEAAFKRLGVLPMNDMVARALSTAMFRGARYADVRIIESRDQAASVKDGRVDSLGDSESIGFGVRALVGNSWGFASSDELTNSEIDRVAALAVDIARASATVPGGTVDLGPPVTSVGRYVTPVEVDPFKISVEEKLDLLFRADAMMRRNPGVKVAESSALCVRSHKTFANSEGAFFEQTIYECGGSIVATAVNDAEIQVRSYPNSYRYQGAAGWEYIRNADFAGNAERVASEAVALLSAAECPAGETTLILGSSQLALQIHESCGHPAELDRVYGTEAAYAGRSFLTTDKRNQFRYGSPIVNLTADSIRPTGLGTFGWDDEGIPASSAPLVKNGLFVGYLMSRETASELGLASNGCMRADGWSRIPLIRMTNVSLEPGTWELDDMIADTQDGILMETNRSWSIDDVRLNFQFGVEVGYEIKNGKLGRLLKNCTYAGMTPQFWNSCDAIANQNAWRLWGTPNCGKGEPMQTMGTGHGAAPGRFRNVRVGISR